MQFDGVIHLGDILGAGVFILTLWSFHISNKRKIVQAEEKISQRTTIMETKIDMIYHWFQDSIITGKGNK